MSQYVRYPSSGSSSSSVITSSSSCGTYETSSTTFVDVTSLHVSVTSRSGKPVRLMITSDGEGEFSFIQTSASNTLLNIRIVDEDGTEYARATSTSFQVTPFYLEAFDMSLAASATKVYKVQAMSSSGIGVRLVNLKLVAYEM